MFEYLVYPAIGFVVTLVGLGAGTLQLAIYTRQ
jgi:hypothetical protein